MKVNELWHRLLVTAIPVVLAAGAELYNELAGSGVSWRLIAKAALSSGLIGLINLWRWLSDPTTPAPGLPASAEPWALDPTPSAGPEPWHLP